MLDEGVNPFRETAYAGHARYLVELDNQFGGLSEGFLEAQFRCSCNASMQHRGLRLWRPRLREGNGRFGIQIGNARSGFSYPAM